MTLDELEQAFRDRQRLSGRRTVILAVQIAEDDLRTLRPVLEMHGVSLSERVRELIQGDVPLLRERRRS